MCFRVTRPLGTRRSNEPRVNSSLPPIERFHPTAARTDTADVKPRLSPVFGARDLQEPRTSPEWLLLPIARFHDSTSNSELSAGSRDPHERPLPRIVARPSLLPIARTGHAKRPLLVLDMDETLLHASRTADDEEALRFTLQGTGLDVFVKFRPHLGTFLSECALRFEVVVFTASVREYANVLLDHIDPHGEHVHHRLFREHCTYVGGKYVKDLSLLGRPLHRIAIVDNSPDAYSMHPGNAIPVTSWFDKSDDTELLGLLPSLRMLSTLDSVYDHLAALKGYRQEAQCA